MTTETKKSLADKLEAVLDELPMYENTTRMEFHLDEKWRVGTDGCVWYGYDKKSKELGYCLGDEGGSDYGTKINLECIKRENGVVTIYVAECASREPCTHVFRTDLEDNNLRHYGMDEDSD